MDEHQWIAMAKKHLHSGAFTPSEHVETSRKKAKIEPVYNVESDFAPKAERKAKRPPSEWNKLVQKHHAMVKGEPDSFQKAIKMAKEERAGTGHKAPPKASPAAKASKEKAPSKKKVQLHLTEYEDL